jgi:iron complex transport system permease protein
MDDLRVKSAKRHLIFIGLNLLAFLILIPIAIFIGDIGAEIIQQIRLPRVATAISAGFAIALASLLTQAIFINPIVEPSFLGVSSGASLGAIIAILLGIGKIGDFTVIVAAAIGAFLTSLLIISLTRGKSALVLILTGIALTAMASSLVGGLISLLNRNDIRSFSFWNLGSLALADWQGALTITVVLLLILPLLLITRNKLNLLSLGETTARSLGINISFLRVQIFFAISFLVAATVSTIGSIAFLGLASAHIARKFVGPNHSKLFLASSLLASNILILSDTLARRAFYPTELPIGFLIALIAAPVLIAALRNQKIWAER